MSEKKDLPDVTSLPDAIAAKAGMPRDGDIDRSMHEISDSIARNADAAAKSWRGSADAAGTDLEIEARNAANATSRIGERAAEAFEKTRDRVRGTVEDVRERAADAYDDARDWAADRYEHHRDRAHDLADRGYDRVYRARSATEAFVADNPLLVGVVGLAAGLLLGALLPRTRQENATLGPWADEARDQGLRYARDATRQGRAFVERALNPDNLDAAVHDAESEARRYQGRERTAHRL